MGLAVLYIQGTFHSLFIYTECNTCAAPISSPPHTHMRIIHAVHTHTLVQNQTIMPILWPRIVYKFDGLSCSFFQSFFSFHMSFHFLFAKIYTILIQFGEGNLIHFDLSFLPMHLSNLLKMIFTFLTWKIKYFLSFFDFPTSVSITNFT